MPVLRYIDYMAIVCDIEPGPDGAVALRIAGQYVVGAAVLRRIGFPKQ